MEDLIRVVPPCSIDSERSVIGAVLQDDRAARMVVKELKPDDFYGAENREIFDSVCAIKGAIDVMTVSNELSRRGTLNSVGGTAYLLECYRYVPTVVNTDSYVEIVKEKSLRRKMISAARRMQESLYSQIDDVAVPMEAMRNELRNIGTNTGDVMTAADVSALTFDYIEQRATGKVKALMTGISSFDRMTGGLLGGDLVIIGARPAVGKSAFGMEIVTNVARAGGKVLVLSREMQAIQYGLRSGSRLSGVSGMQLKTGKVVEQQWEQVTDAYSEFSRLPIKFLFKTRTVEKLRAIAQDAVDNDGLDLIVVDYLQLMGTEGKSEKRYQEVGIVSRTLKDIAGLTHVPVIALAQVSRPAEKRTVVMPVMSELRESGDMEQDADIIMFLHHPEAKSDPSIPSGCDGVWSMIEAKGNHGLVWKFDKQRMGATGSGLFDFDPEHMIIRCVDTR